MPVTVKLIAEVVELAFAGAGAVLLWRYAGRPRSPIAKDSSPLPPWSAAPAEFAFFLLAVVGGSLLAGTVGGLIARSLGSGPDANLVIGGAATQLGMLLGVFGHRISHPPELTPPRKTTLRDALLSGGATFLMTLPLLIVTGKLWELVLHYAGLPAQKQDLIGLFLRIESPALLAVMILLAVVIAPLTEELVFRAGIFRYLRTRTSRVVAYLLPAVAFASLHVNWSTFEGIASFVPLITLAVVFAAAYERTGSIATAIVAHAIFNLNTLIAIFCGVGL